MTEILKLPPPAPAPENAPPPGPEPELVPAAAVAVMLSVSARTLWRMHAAGELPAPVKVGGSTRWRLSEVRAWVEAGCPARRQWEAARKARGR